MNISISGCNGYKQSLWPSWSFLGNEAAKPMYFLASFETLMELPNKIYQLWDCFYDCTHPFYYIINPANKIVFSSCSLFFLPFFFSPPLHSFLFTSVSMICTSLMHYDMSIVFGCVYCTKEKNSWLQADIYETTLVVFINISP